MWRKLAVFYDVFGVDHGERRSPWVCCATHVYHLGHLRRPISSIGLEAYTTSKTLASDRLVASVFRDRCCL